MTDSVSAAIERRDTGMARSADHANAVEESWTARALKMVRTFIITHRDPFLTEQVRGFAEKQGLPTPPDARAWGHVISTAARKGYIDKVGYAPALSSNHSPKVQWRAA